MDGHRWFWNAPREQEAVQSVVSAKWQKNFLSAFITTLQNMEETEPMAASPSPADDSPTKYLSTTEGVEEVMGDTLPPEKGFVQSGRRIELKRRRASAKEGLSTVKDLSSKDDMYPAISTRSVLTIGTPFAKLAARTSTHL
jgi:hypothetical protein